MTCRQVADFIIDYSSGELPVEVRDRFEQHLQRCANCRAYLSQYAATVALGRAVFGHDCASAVAAGIPNELVQAILAARTAP